MTGDGLQADLDELTALAVRLRSLMVGLGAGAPASGPTWQATAAATNGVHASVDAASEALGSRIADTASGVDGAAAKLAGNEGISSDMLSSIGDVVTSTTSPGAQFGGAISSTVGDITSAFTGAFADVAGSLSNAVSAPLGSLAGALDFAALADIADGDPAGLGGALDFAALADVTEGDPAGLGDTFLGHPAEPPMPENDGQPEKKRFI
jgi:hypothetical protein